MSTIIMRDSVRPEHLYGWRGPVAGYIDGRISTWPSTAWERFESGVVRISVLGNPLADVFDVENGNVGAGPVEHAIRLRAEAGLLSVVYTSRSRWVSLRSLLVGVAPSIRWWIADWTGALHSLQGAAAVQFASYATYDVSTVDTSLWPKSGALV